MTSSATPDPDTIIYAQVDYEDSYVQPLILAALEKRIPKDSYKLIQGLDQLPSPSSKLLQFLQYESISFDHLLEHPSTHLANSYVIRKALIRKHYLSTTISHWLTKNPRSVLGKHWKSGVEFEVDYAEFLDDALVEAWELKESWARNEETEEEEEKEWWILKPGMSERGQGIRLFKSEEELTAIFEEWDPESDDEQDEGGARSDDGERYGGKKDEEEGNGIITSQLRHFIAQPYIQPPLLLDMGDGIPPRKFHIRTYVLVAGALKVYVYKPMLALFAAEPYTPPWESAHSPDSLRAHLTNTCLQSTNEREGSVSLFWDLPESQYPGWKHTTFDQIRAITGEVFEAAARSMSIHFQPLPNAFEIFGLDFLVGVERSGDTAAYLLEVNAFPDFKQTGEELKGLVKGLFEGVVEIGIKPFFKLKSEGGKDLVEVRNVDLGRR